jgi:hypothetical protein
MSPAAPQPTHRRPEASRPFASSVRFVKEDGTQYSHPQELDDEVERQYASPGRPSPAASRVYAVSGRDGSPIFTMGDGGVGMKRAKSPLHQRDSLRSRMSPQRAGSRRRMRWERERDIMRGQDLTEAEVRELYQVNNHSLFADLFEDGVSMASWLEFCKKSEEDQRGICNSVDKQQIRKYAGPKMTQDPAELYSRMSSKARGMLERGVGIDFLEKFENALVPLIYSSQSGGADDGDDDDDDDDVDDDRDRDMVMADAAANGGEDWTLTRTRTGAKVTLGESLERMVCHQVTESPNPERGTPPKP